MHCIFLYTLQTKHMPCPTAVTQLVESTGRHTCSEYFFLHLIQDIMDVTTISNKTFEEAILIIHSLIDQMIDKRMFIINRRRSCRGAPLHHKIMLGRVLARPGMFLSHYI